MLRLSSVLWSLTRRKSEVLLYTTYEVKIIKFWTQSKIRNLLFYQTA
jgi:hypothetical protein